MTFRCNKCGKFSQPSSRPGYCKPCSADYQRNWRKKNKLKKNGNSQENIESSSSNVMKSQFQGINVIPPEISGAYVFPHNSQYPNIYPVNPYQSPVPTQNVQMDNELMKSLMSRLDQLEKKNEELEKEIDYLKKNSGIDSNVNLDEHPYGDDYEPNLHPRDLEMRICYNDLKIDDLNKNTIDGLIFKNMDKIQNTVDDHDEFFVDIRKRLDKLEVVDNGLKLKSLEGKLVELENLMGLQSKYRVNEINKLGGDIEGIRNDIEEFKEGLNWFLSVEEGNERETLIVNLVNKVNYIIEFVNRRYRSNIEGLRWPNNYRKFEDLEKRRKRVLESIRKRGLR